LEEGAVKRLKERWSVDRKGAYKNEGGAATESYIIGLHHCALITTVCVISTCVMTCFELLLLTRALTDVSLNLLRNQSHAFSFSFLFFCDQTTTTTTTIGEGC
jgi:hypothetical protein